MSLGDKNEVFSQSAPKGADISTLNYSVYGFIKQSEDNGLITYKVEIENEVVLLTVLGDVHTLKIAGDRNIMVANRYKIKTKSELEFIIRNGRAASLFVSF